MGQLGSNGNLANAETQEGFELRPPGWYPARIIDSDVYIKDGSQHQTCKLEFEFEDGKPGKVWEYLSFANTMTKANKTVAEISQSKLKTIATCGGHPNPNYIADSEELHGLRMQVKLKVEKDESGKYEDKNRITAFKAFNKTQQKPAIVKPAQEAPQQTQAPAETPKMPWE